MEEIYKAKPEEVVQSLSAFSLWGHSLPGTPTCSATGMLSNSASPSLMWRLHCAGIWLNHWLWWSAPLPALFISPELWEPASILQLSWRPFHQSYHQCKNDSCYFRDSEVLWERQKETKCVFITILQYHTILQFRSRLILNWEFFYSIFLSSETYFFLLVFLDIFSNYKAVNVSVCLLGYSET